MNQEADIKADIKADNNANITIDPETTERQDYNKIVENMVHDFITKYNDVLITQETKTETINLPDNINLLLSGGGLSAYYEYGFLKYLDELNKKINKLNINKIYCVSGGAYFAVLYLNKIDINRAIEVYKCEFEKTTNDPIYKKRYLCDIVKGLLEEYLPDDAHLICNDILNIYVYEVGSYGRYTRRLFNNFESKQHLVDIIIASCSIPYVTTRGSVKINDKYYMDGIDIDTTLAEHFDKTIPSIMVDLEHLDYKSKHKISFTDNDIEKIIMQGITDMNEFIENSIIDNNKKNKKKKVIRQINTGEHYKGQTFFYRVTVWVFRYLFIG